MCSYSNTTNYINHLYHIWRYTRYTTVWESLFGATAIGGKASGSRMAGLTATLAWRWCIVRPDISSKAIFPGMRPSGHRLLLANLLSILLIVLCYIFDVISIRCLGICRTNLLVICIILWRWHSVNYLKSRRSAVESERTNHVGFRRMKQKHEDTLNHMQSSVYRTVEPNCRGLLIPLYTLINSSTILPVIGIRNPLVWYVGSANSNHCCTEVLGRC